MAQVPECVVCLQSYDDFLHVPRVLACGHSFCELCLIQLQSAWQPSSSSSISHGSNRDSPTAASGAVIRCPECSHRTRLPVGGQQSLPKNVELLRLLPSLIKEADLEDSKTDDGGGNDTEKKSPAGLKGVAEERSNNNRASGGKVSAGVRRTANRRRNLTTGKSRADSNRYLGSLADGNLDSWLIPCDLHSKDNFEDKDVRKWIVPEKAMKLKGEEDSSSSRFRFVHNNSQNSQGRELFLCGELILERDSLSSSVPVSLLQLMEVTCSPPPQQDGTTMNYEDSVLKAWEGCHHKVKTELLILFRISLLSRRLCNILGVWLNPQRSTLFLVSQVPAVEILLDWEMTKKSFQIEELTDIKNIPQKEESTVLQNSFQSGKSTDVELNTDKNGSGRDALSLSAAETPGPELPTAFSFREKPSSAVAKQLLSRVGLGLFEALWEVHSQGFIFGLLSPNCFVLDRFGNLLIDLNAVLNERSSLHGATTRVSDSSGKCSIPEGECGSSTNAEKDCNGQNYPNCSWRYMSPEALSFVTKNQPCWKDLNPTTDGNAGSSSTSNNEGRTRLTGKADVWSMGCLLLELVSGKAPYDGLTFPEVLQKVFVEKEKPGDFSSLLSDSSLDNSGTQIKVLANLLSKCFDYDPDERPQLEVLCDSFMELGGSNVIPGRSSRVSSLEQHLQREPAPSGGQKYWVLCLPGFVRDGYMDLSDGLEANRQESQRHLELLRLENGAADDGRELHPCGLEQKGTLEGHLDYVTSLVVCGDHLLSSSFDKTVRVWSLEDHTLQQTLKGHSHMVAALAVDPNTFRFFSGDTGANICAWKIGEEGTEPLLATWKEHDDWRYTGVTSLAVSADGVLYSGSGDRTVKAWSLQNFNQIGTMEGHKGLVSALLVDGELLYSGSWDGTIHVWWRSDQSLVAVLDGGTTSNPSLGGVRTLCMSDSFLFAGRDNGAIQVWRDEECLTTVKAHDSVVSALYLEADFLYTGSWDEQIKAWKVDKFLSDPSPTLVRKCGSALSSIVSDGDRLFAGVAERAIKVYSLLGDTWASLVQML